MVALIIILLVLLIVGVAIKCVGSQLLEGLVNKIIGIRGGKG